MKEKTIVRENLMNEKDYAPYCGNDTCFCKNPRTKWFDFKNQFICVCGWVSQFPSDFINRYKEKWNK